MPAIQPSIHIEEHIENIIRILRRQGMVDLGEQYLGFVKKCARVGFYQEFGLDGNIALFRARKNIDERRENIEVGSTFSYPDPTVCMKNGRANIAERPVFYCSDVVNVALNEVRPRKDDIIYLSIWRPKRGIPNAKLSALLSDDTSRDNAWYGVQLKIKEAIGGELDSEDQVLAAEMVVSLADAFVSEKYPYLMSSTAAYLYLYAFDIDMLVYPSFSWRTRFCNCALSPRFVDHNLEISRVYKLHVRESSEVADIVDIVSVGVCNRQRLLWRKPCRDDYELYATLCAKELVIPLRLESPADCPRIASILGKYSRNTLEDVGEDDAESDRSALARIAAIDDEAKCVSELKSYLRRYPNCDMGCYLMGAHQTDRNNFQDAVHYYTKAVRLRPGTAMYHYNRGNAYFKLGDLDSALEDYSRAIEFSASGDEGKSPYLVKSYCNRGSVYQEMELLEKAAADFRMALRHDGNDYLSHFNLGNCLLLDSKFREAIESYTNAIRIEPDDGDIYQNRAVAYLRIGERALAEKDFSKAKELSS